MIVDGFRREIRSGVSGLMGDVQLTASALTYYGEGDAIAVQDSLLLAIDAVKGVKSVVPVIYRSAVLRTENGLQGVLVKATPEYSDSALTVAIPTSLSRKLGVAEGDYLPSYFIGDKVKVRRFKVGRVYPDYLRTDDQQIVLCGLSDLQRVNGWDSTAVSALEVGLAERFSKESFTEIDDFVDATIGEFLNVVAAGCFVSVFVIENYCRCGKNTFFRCFCKSCR